jgi:hypothetical protein
VVLPEGRKCSPAEIDSLGSCGKCVCVIDLLLARDNLHVSHMATTKILRIMDVGPSPVV